MKIWAVSTAIGVGMALALLGCGGGGDDDGGSVATNDPAPEPVCSAVSRSGLRSSQGELGGRGVTVPESTRERAEDLGVSAHTDHLINRAASGRADGPTGLFPAGVRAAYGIPDGKGAGAIAIIAAYHAPTMLNDFNVFSSTFGLPQETGGAATGSNNAVLQVVYAGGSQPTANSGWAQEASLDTQWTHAMAPGAKIYLVEANTARLSDLMAAVAVARALPGVRQISMSFGASEDPCFYTQYDRSFQNAGIPFFAAAGDTAGERDFPALSRDVIAVGGTSLRLNADGSRRAESAWSDTGGGPSEYSPRPSFQDVVLGSVGRYRGACDVSAVSDPQTGVSVYCSTPDDGVSGWLVIGGTSAATPIVAGIANAAGTTGLGSRDLATRLYGALGTSTLFDVQDGAADDLEAGPGWDFPTGVGTPNGLGAF